MGILYLIRHGQRFPIRNFEQLESVDFGDESVLHGQLTGSGRARMRQLGAAFKDVPIVAAKSRPVQRCQDSLSEFLTGANSNLRPEKIDSMKSESLDDLIRMYGTETVKETFNSCIRNREAFDDLLDKYLPDAEKSVYRDVDGMLIIDTLAILEDRGGQKMTTDLRELDLDVALAWSLASRSHLREPIRETILDAFGNRDGHTVVFVSDIHLLYVLQRVAPGLVQERPPFGSVLKITPTEDNVVLEYQDQAVELPLAEFHRMIELDMPTLNNS